MSTWLTVAVLALTVALTPMRGVADEDDHDHAADSDAAGPSVEHLARFGVTLATAAPGEVDTGVELPAEVRADADRVAHLAPRYPGVLREVHAQLGDTVRAGATLAIVESATLSRYTVQAPFDGVVIDRDAVLGESVSPERPILVVADLSTVWVEIAVYQKDLALVHAGQAVTISAGYGLGDARGTVSYVSPVLDQSSRTATARVVLPNPDGRWQPGLFARAAIEEPVKAAVVVPRNALQRLDGATVVFVADHGVFTPRPVTVGQLGRQRTEITAGLHAGERLAADNSFLVKAELEKGTGGHDH
ncbi:MAG: efflux RND transporter periplasmic adaptor subunit [Deltaproteobacteria bacterium]|nr:efflux RND transporter periplasmic adaptor subunit [Deltaproteobacteria bacterium]